MRARFPRPAARGHRRQRRYRSRLSWNVAPAEGAFGASTRNHAAASGRAIAVDGAAFWPLQLRVEAAHEEGGVREWAVATTKLTGDKNGNVKQLHAVRVGPAPKFAPIAGTEFTIEADLVLLAMGFLGPVKTAWWMRWASSWTSAVTSLATRAICLRFPAFSRRET